ncbi:MAG: ABC transporter permease, partial [Gammaproteobacteria bacterium]
LPNYSLFSYLLAGILIVGLLLLQIPNLQLIAVFLGSLLFASAVLYATALGLIALIARLRMVSVFRYGLANLARRAHSNAVQLVAFGLVIMIILLLTLIRNDVFHSWQQQLKPNAPNYFAINIQPTEVENFNQFLTQHAILASEIYPMVRGRLLARNNIPILHAIPSSARNHNALQRELNLTWTHILPSDNRVIAGHWGNGISIEKKLAHDLGIMMGDTLTFQIGDRHIQDTVRSVRTLHWDSFHPNFYIIFPSEKLNNLPATYITSFYISPAQKPFLSTLIKQYPNITLIDIALILTQVREFTNKMALAIELILGFTVFAGFAVLYAALQTSRDERLLEGAILRTLGANSQFLRVSLATEFMTLGFLAGLLGAAGASLIAFILSNQIFQMPYSWALWPWIVGVVGGTLLVGLGGIYGTRDVLKYSPLVVLQEVS